MHFPDLEVCCDQQFILPNKTLMDGKSLSLGDGETDPPFSFLVLLHVGLWVVIFISDRTLQYLHHQSQARGYLEFFRETKELRRFPHYVLSTGLQSVIHRFLKIQNTIWSQILKCAVISLRFSLSFQQLLLNKNTCRTSNNVCVGG